MVASERDRPDVAHRRAQWHKYQDRIAPERLVFIDETWTRTNMTALRGWAPRGQRLQTNAPHGHWKTTTFLAALRHDRIDAPWLRRQTVEHPFGTIKSWMGSTHFQMKTLKHVSTELALHVYLAYNMKRVMRILSVGGLMEAIRT